MEDKYMEIEEINKFLKGIHMGAKAFKDYLERAKSENLRNEIIVILESFERHENAITSRINQLGGNATDTIGIMGMMGEFFEKMKLIPVDTDEEVKERAIKAMQMGIKNAQKFIDEHSDLEESILSDIRGVVKDYDNQLRRLESIIL